MSESVCVCVCVCVRERFFLCKVMTGLKRNPGLKGGVTANKRKKEANRGKIRGQQEVIFLYLNLS